MRIALISRGLPPRGGGIATYTEKTARTLAAFGHEVHVLTEAEHGKPAREAAGAVTIHRLPRGNLRPSVLARAWVVARALRRLGPFDVVQACEWDAEAAIHSLRHGGRLVTRLATPHYLVERLNGVSRAQRRPQALCRRLERLQTRRSARVISPSSGLAREVARAWRIPPEAITVVPTGIRTPEAAGGPPAELAGRSYVLYFGRLEVRKGVDVWLDALPGVLRRHPGLEAVLVGEDLGIRGRSFVEYAAERCGDAAGRVRFLPQLPHAQLFPIVAAADLVVMPSRWENLANACLEAMALGRPVVATSGSGFDDLVEHGHSGFLVPPGDATALAAAVEEALADPARLRSMGEAARRRAAEFDLVAMVERLVDVYGGLVNARDGAAPAEERSAWA